MKIVFIKNFIEIIFVLRITWPIIKIIVVTYAVRRNWVWWSSTDHLILIHFFFSLESSFSQKLTKVKISNSLISNFFQIDALNSTFDWLKRFNDSIQSFNPLIEKYKYQTLAGETKKSFNKSYKDKEFHFKIIPLKMSFI